MRFSSAAPDSTTIDRILVSASRLTRRFGDRIAVDSLTLQIAGGEVFALLGPNGAGKTTTLRMIAGMIQPTTGTITIDGVPLTARTASAIRGRIGLLTEAPGLWDRLTLRTNLLVYARLFGVADPGARVDRLLHQFDLWERRHDLAAELSKGMRQKAALVRALVHDPMVVLLDEPTAGLDPQTSRAVRELVLDLRTRGRAILVSTHNLDEAERVADRIAVLQRTLVAVDAPDALRQRLFGRRLRIDLVDQAGRFAEVVKSTGAHNVTVQGESLSIGLEHPEVGTPEIVRALVLAGARIRRVGEEQRPLEEVYLKLIEVEERGSDVTAQG